MRVFHIGVFAAAALLVAGCGGDVSAPSTTAAPSSSTVATTASSAPATTTTTSTSTSAVPSVAPAPEAAPVATPDPVYVVECLAGTPGPARFSDGTVGYSDYCVQQYQNSLPADSAFTAPGYGYQCPGTDAFVSDPSQCTVENLGGVPLQ